MDPLPPLIKHKSTELYYTSTAWAIEKSAHTQGRQTPHETSTGLQSQTTPGYYDLLKNVDIPPANQAQVYRSLLHHDNMSYWEIKKYPGQTDPPQIKHRFTEPSTPGYYDLLKNWDIPPTNQAQVYRDPLYHDSMSYWEIYTYAGQMDPPNWAQVYRALLHMDSIIYWEIET